MEKHYFKYNNGYVNIDAENLYLTTTGNWQETHALEEKGKSSIAMNNARITKMKGGVYTLFGFIASALIYMMEKKIYAIPVFAGLAFLAHRIFIYFKAEFGMQYKIPFNKITGTVIRSDNGLTINFLNAANKPDFEMIDNIDPKGFKVLWDLGILK